MKKYEVKISLNYTSIMNLGYSHERINKGIEVDIDEDKTITKTFFAKNILDFINNFQTHFRTSEIIKISLIS